MSVNRCVNILRLQRRVSALTVRSAGASPDSRLCCGSPAGPQHHSPAASLSFSRAASFKSSPPVTPDTSLFVPLAFKADSCDDGSVGAELTQPLDKSELRVF